MWLNKGLKALNRFGARGLCYDLFLRILKYLTDISARRKSRSKAGDLDQDAKLSTKIIVSLLPTNNFIPSWVLFLRLYSFLQSLLGVCVLAL
jgi:hypothetical protein